MIHRLGTPVRLFWSNIGASWPRGRAPRRCSTANASSSPACSPLSVARWAWRPEARPARAVKPSLSPWFRACFARRSSDFRRFLGVSSPSQAFRRAFRPVEVVREVTNFQSAHDVNGDRGVSRFFFTTPEGVWEPAARRLRVSVASIRGPFSGGVYG